METAGEEGLWYPYIHAALVTRAHAGHAGHVVAHVSVVHVRVVHREFIDFQESNVRSAMVLIG